MSQVVSNRKRRDQATGMGEVVAIVHCMKAAVFCWMHNEWIAAHRRCSVIDVVDVPALVSTSRTYPTRSTKGHDCWAIVSWVRL